MFRITTSRGRVLRPRRGLAPEVHHLEGRALLSTAPTTMADVVGQAGQNGYYISPVTINLTASEPNVSPSSLTTEYSVNHGPFITGNQITLNDNGTDVVQFFSRDNSGNVEATQTRIIKIDMTRPQLTETATPQTLWPPNHKFDTVTVSGSATDPFSGINHSRVFFFVRDEYGQVQPRGFARVRPSGQYSIPIQLQASRTGQDHDGRQYTIFVVAQSGAGLTTLQSVVVTVPHDQGHSGGSGSGSTGQGDDDQGDDDQGSGSGKHGHGDEGGNDQGNGHGHGNGHKNGHGHGDD